MIKLNAHSATQKPMLLKIDPQMYQKIERIYLKNTGMFQKKDKVKSIKVAWDTMFRKEVLKC